MAEQLAKIDECVTETEPLAPFDGDPVETLPVDLFRRAHDHRGIDNPLERGDAARAGSDDDRREQVVASVRAL